MTFREETGLAHPIDIYVGQRVRARRLQLGFTQIVLGEKLKVSFQAIQKYECGDIRMAASRLFELAEALAVPVSYFFEGCKGGGASEHPGGPDIVDPRTALPFLRALAAIKSTALRLHVLAIVKALGGAAADEPRTDVLGLTKDGQRFEAHLRGMPELGPGVGVRCEEVG